MDFFTPGPSRLAWLRPLIDYRRRLACEAAQARLDADALRDLGLDRSELASYLAEASGRAPATRRRLAPLAGTRGGA